ncbi:MAG TPA: DUF1566 domain-containing protein [Dissulfuribacter thermophilus]|uniref:DUF1566 domain-containing protein n=1 Tax=Dissulfuribacter thermophilus TaxID=1156395 RepID=A0A7V2SUW4_9BACT|nr:DUF1566 domain-containing protein [Dissulfuribacter thermophilus]
MKAIGRYEILSFLGRGAWSLVFRVKIPRIEKVAALKLLQPDPLLKDLLGLQNMEELFLREASILGRIRHPHVVQVWDFDYWRKKPFFIMEFYCISLQDVIGKGQPSRVLRLDDAVSYTLQVLKGLQCLHEVGIVHRDIKPENLLLTDDDQVKIADFGLVHMEDAPISHMVPENLVVGSPDWAAPEQLMKKSHKISPATDLYSVGVLLFKMLTGRYPKKKEQPNLSKYNPDCGPEWDEFIKKALMEDTSKRFGCAFEMESALKRLYHTWKEQTLSQCAFMPKAEVDHEIFKNKIRSEPRVVSVDEALEQFFLDDLYRPKVWTTNRYRHIDEFMVLDEATGLVWEAHGSSFPTPWEVALARAERLNEAGLGGLHTWHLPTVEELVTILDPIPHKTGHCVESVFDLEKSWLWTSDVTGHKMAWCANAKNGFIAHKDKSCYLFSRLVAQQ